MSKVCDVVVVQTMSASSKTCRLLSMLALTSVFFLIEIVVGYVTNSIALIADSFHMLSDVVALIVGFASIRVSCFSVLCTVDQYNISHIVDATIHLVLIVSM